MRLSIRVDGNALEALRRMPARLEATINGWADRAAQYSRGVMVQTIRDRQQAVGRTGILSNSVTAIRTPTGFTVGPTAEYAVFVDQPTRPHDIYPRTARALAFASAGGVITRSTTTGHVRSKFTFGGKTTIGGAVFARHVRHPGTRGLFFVDATAEALEDPLAEMLAADLEKALQEDA